MKTTIFKPEYSALAVLILLMFVSGGLWVWVDHQGMSLPICSVQQVGSQGPIRINFPSQMDQSSVLERISIQPKIKVNYRWEENQLQFWPLENLDEKTGYQITLKQGAMNFQGKQKIQQDWACTYHVRPPSILYQSIDRNAGSLFLADLDGKSSQRLASFNHLIQSFSILRGGEKIAVLVKNEQGGSDLWLVNRDGTQKRLAAGGKDHFESPDWSPDGKTILFSRSIFNSATAQYLPHPQIWQLFVDTLKLAPLFQNPEQYPGINPQFSADGQKMTYYDLIHKGVRIVSLDNMENVLLRSNSSISAWMPDSNGILYFSEGADQEVSFSDVFLYELVSKKSAWLLDEYRHQFEFGIPEFSPDGSWVVMSVRLVSGSPNKQLVLIKMDGSEVKTITDDQLYLYSSYHWSPDGKRLIYQHLKTGSSSAVPQIMLWDWESGTTKMVIDGGSTPMWIP